ncbi:hypothetical protein [Corynebacterium sp.]|uniref:hypothetical protein n=1 Tax=Corynebacterium sp. TaxID=1720 RepID=UPI0037362DBE
MSIRRTAVAAALVAPAVFLAACGTDAEVPEQPQASESSTTAPSQPPTSENSPGAMVGNDQRTWPDPDGMFDDSAHAAPGTWSVDFYHQRPVWTPDNHDGDLPSKRNLVEGGFEQCQTGDVPLNGKTTQQYVNARYLAVNDQAGPSRMEDGVPAGFAHSPQGAVMLALNAVGYGIAGQGDGIGEEIDAAWWSTYETLQKDREFRHLNDPNFDHSQVRAEPLPAAGYYNVTQCTEDVVVVEVGHDFTKASGEAMKTTIPVYWRDGDWVPDLSGQAGILFDKGGTFNPDNPAPMKEIQY